MEYYVVNKSGVFREHLLYGKNFTVKSEKLGFNFLYSVLSQGDACICTERKHLKSGFVLFTAGHVASERVLSKCLLK